MQCAAHHFAQRTADDQSQPGAASCVRRVLIHLYKWTEQATLVFRRDSDSAVLNQQRKRKAERFNQLAAHGDFYETFVGELDGVADQIGQHLLESQRIDEHIAIDVRVHVQNQLQVFVPSQSIENPEYRLHQFPRIAALGRKAKAAGLDTHDIEYVPNQLQQAIRSLMGNFDTCTIEYALVRALQR